MGHMMAFDTPQDNMTQDIACAHLGTGPCGPSMHSMHSSSALLQRLQGQLQAALRHGMLCTYMAL